LVYRQEQHLHRYPHCWRCGGELVHRLVDEWFIACDELRPRLIEAAETVRWVPEHAGKRMLDWLRNMNDWCISRKRYWGLPLPICEAENGEWIVVGSRAELRRLAVEPQRVDALPELHRPWIDAVELRFPSGERARRVPEVGDCWLDAGIVPFSTLGYSGGDGAWSKWYPADFAVEMREQIRLWFYSMLFMGVTLSGRAPYRTVMCYEKMRDATGQPMHKSVGNALWFDEVVKEQGADPMRWLFAGQNISLDMRYGPEGVREVKRRFLTLWNRYRFYVQYANIDADALVAQKPKLAWVDRWLLARLQDVVARVEQGLEDWDLPSVVREVERFIDELSNWYVRLNRRRFWKGRDDTDKSAAHWTLRHALKTLCLLLAPLMPFTSEKIYQNLVRKSEGGAPESVHLCAFPSVDAQFVDRALLESMALIQKVINCGRVLRRQAVLKVCQPLSRLVVDVSDEVWSEFKSCTELICNELNVKALERGKRCAWMQYKVKVNLRAVGPRLGQRLPALVQAIAAADSADLLAALDRTGVYLVELKGAKIELCRSDLLVEQEPRPGWCFMEEGAWNVALETHIDESLRHEGIAREFTHAVQGLRRQLSLALEDRIMLCVNASEEIARALLQHAPYICAETLCDKLRFAAVEGGQSIELGAVVVEVGIHPLTR
jgi:isoleucyl-tRNA synthetase